MKIKTRAEKTTEYNNKYKNIPVNITTRLVEEMNRIGYSAKQIEEIITKAISIRKKLRYTEISTILYEVPFHTHRSRHKGKITYVPNAKEHHNFMAKYVSQLAEDDFSKVATICTECFLTINAYFPIPSAMNKVERILAELGYIRPIGKPEPDHDNIGKAYSDMLNINVFLDDSFVVSGSVNKYYSFKPRVEIKIKYANNHISKYNQAIALKKIESLGLVCYQNIELLEE